MRRRLAIAAVLAAATLSCAGPALAAAEPTAPVLLSRVSQLDDQIALLGQGSGSFGLGRGPVVSEIRFQNHDGYRIVVLAARQTVALSVIRRDGKKRPATTTYLAHGKVTPGSIRASFADRGEIDLRFGPIGRQVHASRRVGCKTPSDHVIAQLGLFAGKLRFQGEGGYTSTDVHRVHGGLIDVRAVSACLRRAPHRRALRASSVPSVPAHPSHPPERTRFVAESNRPLARTIFGAVSHEGDLTRFLAVEASTEGQVGILRLATASAPPTSFVATPTLAGATVTPPAPFRGKGIYEHGPGSAKSWTGSLSVSFLGAPHVSLTGDPFSTELVRNW
jgi:hypothetical protein